MFWAPASVSARRPYFWGEPPALAVGHVLAFGDCSAQKVVRRTIGKHFHISNRNIHDAALAVNMQFRKLAKRHIVSRRLPLFPPCLRVSNLFPSRFTFFVPSAYFVV